MHFSRNGFNIGCFALSDQRQYVLQQMIVIPEIQNIMGNRPSNRNRPEPSTSLTQDGIGNSWKNTSTTFTKMVLWSVCDLRENTDLQLNNFFGPLSLERFY